MVFLIAFLLLLVIMGLAVSTKERANAIQDQVKEVRESIDALEDRLRKIESRFPVSVETRAKDKPGVEAAAPVPTSKEVPQPAPRAPAGPPAHLARESAGLPASLLRLQEDTSSPQAPPPNLRPPAQHTTPGAGPGIETWEVAIGGSWLNRIGVTLLVIGIAFALGYTLTHLGPRGKSLLATAVSLALLVGGMLLERREGFTFYGRGLIAGGWAALYATAYAVHELAATRVIESARTGFLLLLLVAIGMVLHSLRYRNQGLTGLAYGLAYSAIVLHSVSPYTLAAATLLGLGTMLHLLRRRWYGVALAGIVATYGSLFLWYVRQRQLSPELMELTLGALMIDWCVFLVADFAPEARTPQDRLKARMVASLNATAAGWLSYLAWNRTSAPSAWHPLLILGLLYILTSVVLRRLGRPTAHRMHSLAAALLVGLAAGKAFDQTGASWAWIAEAQAFVFIGVILKDRFHRILGCTLFLAPMGAVVSGQWDIRMQRTDGIFDRDYFLLTAAACGSFYLTYTCLKAFVSSDPAGRAEGLIRRAFSYAAFLLIILGTVVQLPLVYVAPAGAMLMVLLFEISAPRRLRDLRVQCHMAAAWAALAALAMSAPSLDLIAGHRARIPALLTVAAGYFALFLRQRGARGKVLEHDTILRPLYSWAGSLLVALLIWLESRPVVVGPAWLILALLLMETGIALQEIHLRRPGYVAMVMAQGSLVVSNLTATDLVGSWSVRALTLVPAVAATYYVWLRLRSFSDPSTKRSADELDEWFGRMVSYLGASLAGLFFRFEFGLDGAALRWSLTMIVLLTSGYLLRDADFRMQAYLLGGAVFVRAVGFDFQHASPVFGVDGALAVTVAAVCGYLAAGFLIRNRLGSASTRPDRRSVGWETRLRTRGPDLMWLLAVSLAAIYLYRTRTGSMLIVAWAVEGLVVTGGGFGLASRALRLSGLGLLGIALATTLEWAFTTFDTLGRIVSFIVLGLVLLLVSFVYTRDRSRIRRSR